MSNKVRLGKAQCHKRANKRKEYRRRGEAFRKIMANAVAPFGRDWWRS